MAPPRTSSPASMAYLASGPSAFERGGAPSSSFRGGIRSYADDACPQAAQTGGASRRSCGDAPEGRTRRSARTRSGGGVNL